MELVEAFVALLRKRGRAVTQEKHLWMKIMLQRIYKRLRSENANTLIENVIILPLIIIVIYFMILASFVIHDHSTLDAAAKRGTIYAARCISDPNYPMILQQSGHQSGMLDTNVTQLNADSFNGVGDNIKPYRYLVMNTADIRDATVNEISNIIQHTKIPWREIETGDIAVKIDNKIIYQNVEVSITARYPLPKIFGNFGLPTEFNYTVTAATAVNDPDEFIRNVDLIIDVCAAIDRSTGGNIQKVLGKLNDMGTKLTQFLSGEKGFGGSGGAGAPAGGGGEGDHFAEAGDNDGEENGSGKGGTEAEGENGSGDFAGIGVGNGTGSAGNGGNVSTGGLGIVAAPGGDENREDKEEATSQQIRDSMITRFGQANVDAISEGVDTSTWTEDDWYIYMQEYLLNGSLPGDWIAPTSTPVPTPSSTPGVESEDNKFFVDDTLRAHIENVDPNVPRKRGIGGAHNREAFLQNDIQIVSVTSHPEIPGIEIIEYQMPKLDKTGTPIPGEYQTGKPKRKTVYDPSVFSTEEYLRRGVEAANNASEQYSEGTLPREWSGYDSQGIKWRGYYENGVITSFYPE